MTLHIFGGLCAQTLTQTRWSTESDICPNPHPPGPHADNCQKNKQNMGDTVQVGPPAGWGPLLSSALLELSVARPLSCSVTGLARFSLPQAPSRPDLRLASSGHTRVTRAEHRHSAIQRWNPMEPTHSMSPLSLQEAGVSERCPPAPDIPAAKCTRVHCVCSCFVPHKIPLVGLEPTIFGLGGQHLSS